MRYMLLGALALFILAFGTRAQMKTRPSPVGKPGETPQAAHTMLLGAFRFYSWLIWLHLGIVVLALMGGDEIRGARLFQIPAAVMEALLLLAASSLYFRLGYSSFKRGLFVLGHLSGVFAFTEYFLWLSSDMQYYLDRHARGQGFTG